MSEFILAMPFYTAQTTISQQNGKKGDLIHHDHLQNLFSQPSCSTPYWFSSTSQIKSITFHKLWSCSHMAFSSVQSNCPGLVTDSGTLSHDNTMCGFHSLVRTLTLLKQLQKVGETLELFLLLLKASDSWMPIYHFKKGCYGIEKAKEQIQGFCWGSEIHSYIGLSAGLLISELLCLPLCLISGVPEWLRDQWSSWGSQLAGERSNGLWGIKK